MKVTVVGAGNVGATCAQRIAEADLADVYLAVSYTHLDVYKRQGQSNAHSCRRRPRRGDGMYPHGTG